MKDRKLNKSEISTLLKTIPGWSVKNGKLHRQLEFPSFLDAFAFITKAAIISEKKDHHPEWYNVYNKVTIDLTTHDLKGISTRDFNWVRAINELLVAPA